MAKLSTADDRNLNRTTIAAVGKRGWRYSVNQFNFQEGFDEIFEDVDLSIDERLERLVGLLNRLEPALLETAARCSDAEIEIAFLEFVDPETYNSRRREARFLIALAGAGELKRRADRAGVTVMEYARLIKVRREMDDI